LPGRQRLLRRLNCGGLHDIVTSSKAEKTRVNKKKEEKRNDGKTVERGWAPGKLADRQALPPTLPRD